MARREQFGMLRNPARHGRSADQVLKRRTHLHLEALESRIVLTGNIHTIQHVVILMQENRSFDSYFGTYPGADGIPPGVEVYDPLTMQYQAPYLSTAEVTVGGPHGNDAAVPDIDGGKMDGFLSTFRKLYGNGPTDVMAHWDAQTIPNYWSYANNFVLQEHLFCPVLSWSLPSHMYEVSGWSASCSDPNNPFS